MKPNLLKLNLLLLFIIMISVPEVFSDIWEVRKDTQVFGSIQPSDVRLLAPVQGRSYSTKEPIQIVVRAAGADYALAELKSGQETFRYMLNHGDGVLESYYFYLLDEGEFSLRIDGYSGSRIVFHHESVLIVSDDGAARAIMKSPPIYREPVAIRSPRQDETYQVFSPIQIVADAAEDSRVYAEITWQGGSVVQQMQGHDGIYETDFFNAMEEGEYSAKVIVQLPSGNNATSQVSFHIGDPPETEVNISYKGNHMAKRAKYTGRLEDVLAARNRTSLTIHNLTGAIRKIIFNDLSFNGSLELGAEDIEMEGYVQSYAIDPERVDFSNATVTVTAKGSELYKCANWSFDLKECLGEWALILTDLIPGENYTIILTPDDPAFREMPIQQCNAEDAAVNAGTWGSVCDNSYPGPALFYDDSTYETHRVRRQGGTYYWAGLRTRTYNSSVTDCDAIQNVFFCYKWWAATTYTTTCDISIDANGGASYYTLTTTCPATAEPGAMTCVNVSSYEPWSCNNFFTSTGAMAKSEARAQVGAGTGYYNVNWDVFYFNVTYLTYPPSWSANSTYVPAAFTRTGQSEFNITWQSKISLSAVLFESNYTGSRQNYTMAPLGGGIYGYSAVLPAGSFYWKSYANDTRGQMNMSGHWQFSIPKATPILTLSATPGWNAVYGTQTDVDCSASDPEVTPMLYRDGVYVGVEDIATLGGGTYNYICNNTQTQNFTTTAASNTMSISKQDGEVHLYLNGSRNNRTIMVGSIVNISSVIASGNGGIRIYNNHTLMYDGSSPSENLVQYDIAGLYNMTAIYDGNQNYTGDFETWWLNVSDSTPPDNLPEWSGNRSVIPAIYDESMESYFNITWTDDFDIHTVYLESNFTGYGVNYSMNEIVLNVYNFSRVLPAGAFYWSSHANDSAGNWSHTPRWDFSIGKAVPSLVLSADPAWTNTYGTQTTVSCSPSTSQISARLYRNDTLISGLIDARVLNASTYNYTCNSTGSTNYTAAENSNLMLIDKAISEAMLYLNGTRADRSYQVYTYGNMTAILAAGEGNITVHKNQSLLYNGTPPTQMDYLWSEVGYWNISMNYEGNNNYFADSESWWANVTPLPPIPKAVEIGQCRAEDNEANPGSWGSVCDHPYPGSALFYDDTEVETHTTRKQGGAYSWAGLMINSTNTTVVNCKAIEKVEFCYKWWSEISPLANCDISVDADSGSSYSIVSAGCPGTSEPASVTCIEVTGFEPWSCDTFFGLAPTGGMAKSEAIYGGGANGVYALSWDVFFFNVSYSEKEDILEPNATLLEPVPGTVFSISALIDVTVNATDDVGIQSVVAQIKRPDNSMNYFQLNFLGNDLFYGQYPNTSLPGVYNMTIVVTDGSGKQNTTETSWFNVTYNAQSAKYCEYSPCIVDSSLIRSRDNIGPTGEPNQPNTIDGCTDGNRGTYLADESLENITFESLNGTEFRGGDTVRANITVHCKDAFNDNVNFVYSNSSLSVAWKVMSTLDPCPASGMNTISRTFTLDRNLGIHAFRGILQYRGSGTATCGGGTYDDNDDLEFLVDKPREKIPPAVTVFSPQQLVYVKNNTVSITVEVTDQTDVEGVYANFTWDDKSWAIPLTVDADGNYTGIFTNTSFVGNYMMRIYANDTFSNINDTEIVRFQVDKSLYQTYYGSVQANFTLGKQQSVLFMYSQKIPVNIFATDVDFTWSIEDLQALGRRKDGSLSTQDFGEIDARLGIVNRTDSIAKIWASDNSTPRLTRTFTISGTSVYDVPIVNSTNSSDFVTGILWDTADSPDEEYDGSEDIVLITAYNAGKQGMYGVYGYEVKVPWLLGSISGTNNLVHLYTEVE